MEIPVSVIMPVFNSERFIYTAVESVLNQSFNTFELLTIDDNSKDQSIRIIQEFHDNRIRILNSRGNGAVSAYNEGIINAKGKFISIMDHDDIADITRLEKQFNIIQNSDVDIVGCFYKVIDEDGKIIHSVKLPMHDKEIKDSLFYSCSILNSGCLIKKSVIDKYGLYDEKAYPSQDYEFWLRVRDNVKFYNIPEYLQYWRALETAPSNTMFALQRERALYYSVEYIDKNSMKLKPGEYEFLKGQTHYYLDSPRKSIKWFYKSLSLGYITFSCIRYFFFSFFGFLIIKFYRDYISKRFFQKSFKHSI